MIQTNYKICRLSGKTGSVTDTLVDGGVTSTNSEKKKQDVLKSRREEGRNEKFDD